MKLNNEKGFILPLAVMLVVMLSMSGASMLHLQFLEIRSTVNEANNQNAFYLASTGLERSRETFKIPDTLDWTNVLNNGDANYPRDTSPNPLLCPDTVAHGDWVNDPAYRGCVIPSFGSSVSSSSVNNLIFDGTFDKGSYTVRAYNDEASTTDSNGVLILRALGNVNGEQKLLEVSIRATSGLNLMNCGDALNCPHKNNPRLPVDCEAPYCIPSDGREPESGPIPTLVDPDPSDSLLPLEDSTSFYRTPSNFSGHNYNTLAVDPEGRCSIDAATASANPSTIFFCNGRLTIENGVALTNSVVIGVNEVRLVGSASVNNNNTAPLPYPSIITNGDVTTSNANGVVYGTIYASGPYGSSNPGYATVDLGPLEVHGVLIGDYVALQGLGQADEHTVYTDDNNPAFYDLMPGFDYPDETKKNDPVTNTWRELQ